MDIDIQKLKSADRRTLAKAITLIESQLPEDQDKANKLLSEILPDSGQSIRVAVTGVPGVGKSTFIEALGLELVKLGKKVAVLAIDPTSPKSGGSILGDKTRMEELSRSDLAFIRPTPTAGSLGGVAYKTREAMLLCEAAGFDVVFIETVGVGQSEYNVASIVDLNILLMLPNAGDELQGIKKGIMEICDFLIINKADGENLTSAKTAKSQYESALHILGSKANALLCSSTEKTNINEIWKQVEAKWGDKKSSGDLGKKRSLQNLSWMQQLLNQRLRTFVNDNEKAKSALDAMSEKVMSNEIMPIEAVEKVFQKIKGS